MRLYISGPMTGLPEFNYPAFHEAKAKLGAAGYEVISPADLPLRDDWEWIDYMMLNIDSVFAAEGITSLRDWEKSRGARIEHKIAVCRSIPIRPVEVWL